MQAIRPALIMQVDELKQLISSSIRQYAIEGVTFLGGEPLIQAQALSDVAEYAQGRGLSVMVFTGYTYPELLSSKMPGVDKLIRHTDVLVDGVYLVDCPDHKRNWVGSTNQKLHYFSKRYDSAIESDPVGSGAVEFRVKGDHFFANGCPFALGEVLTGGE
jgi:anaerobic ribonucleoside-triphosphate reductase activating protein